MGLGEVIVEGLTKRYRMGQPAGRPTSLVEALTTRSRRHGVEFEALSDVSLTVAPGEVLGLIGPNGAGKSTLLKILAKITPPTKGRAILDGHVGSLLEVGTGFHPELTGRENIFLNGAILGMPKAKIRSQFDAIVDFSEIGAFLDTPVKRYSSGMYVRLAFSVASHLETDILLVDEVLAVGDAGFQAKCLGRMEHSANEGRTIIFVSHDMGAVAALCDRACLLERGRLTADGPAQEVIRDYLEAVALGAARADEGPGIRVDPEVLATGTDFSITGLRVTNPQSPSLGATTGEPLRVEIDYLAQRPFLEAAFVLRFRGLLGTDLLRLSSMPISGFRLPRLEGKGTMVLEIDALPFTAGRYMVDLAVARANIDFVADHPGAFTMQVQAADVYDSGFAVTHTHGMIVTPHHWEHHA